MEELVDVMNKAGTQVKNVLGSLATKYVPKNEGLCIDILPLTLPAHMEKRDQLMPHKGVTSLHSVQACFDCSLNSLHTRTHSLPINMLKPLLSKFFFGSLSSFYYLSQLSQVHRDLRSEADLVSQYIIELGHAVLCPPHSHRYRTFVPFRLFS